MSFINNFKVRDKQVSVFRTKWGGLFYRLVFLEVPSWLKKINRHILGTTLEFNCQALQTPMFKGGTIAITTKRAYRF